MFCEKCGTKNADGAKFCAGCGAALEQSAQQNTYTQYKPAAPQTRGVTATTRVLMLINAICGLVSLVVIFLPIRSSWGFIRNFFDGQSAFNELIRSFEGRDKTKAILYLVLLTGTIGVLIAGVILSFMKRKGSAGFILAGCTYLACYCYAWMATSTFAYFTFVIYFMALAAIGGIVTSALVLSKYKKQ